MRKNVLIAITFALLLPLGRTLAQSTNGEGDPEGRENWIPNRGNVGIGTRTPTEALDVIGNVKVSETIYTNSLQTVGLSANNLSVSVDATIGRNLLVSGNVGINVSNPVERLEIGGNLKVSGSITADVLNVRELTTQIGRATNTFTIDQKLLVNGLTGLGVAAPVERLEVGGNIKATGDVMAVNVRADKGYFKSLESDGNLLINGNVGIGVASPEHKLHVDGNIKATGALLGQSAQVSGDASIGNNLSITGKVGIGGAPGAEQLNVSGTSYFNGLLTTENVIVKQKLELKGAFSVAGTFGVGVSSPESALHVNGDGKFNGDLRANKLYVKAIEIEGATSGGSGEGSNVSLGDNLFVNGSMGIGTTKINGYRLSVDGKIRAGDDIKVYVSSEWSDFVFKDDYKLRPLTEVEAYIKQNGHLPEIPSAASIQKDGFDLGAMDAKLLQKIEELTLYMIEMKKENEALKNQLRKIESSVKKK